MDVRFCPTDMDSLSELKTEALCLPFYRDERPMRGPAGLVDFRLCGKVSKLIARGRMDGELGEAVLMTARPRLSAERLLWIGGGLASELGEPRYRQLVREVFVRLAGMRVRAAALSLPGRSRNQIDAALAIDWFLEEARGFSERLDELTLLEPEDAVRAMRPRVERARRRALADP